MYCRYGVNVFGKTVKLMGNLPIQRGLASSAACSTAFSLSLFENSMLPKEEELIDLARDGERVIHRNVNAGGIDISTSFYGGFVSYDSRNGSKAEKINKNVDLLVVDTGPKKSTAEMVSRVSDLYNRNRASTDALFNRIDECSKKGISALRNGDVKTLGECMFYNHDLLRQLGVSTPNLDSVVEIAKGNLALGAKLSGGGGGGIAVVLVDPSTHIEAILEELRSKKYGIINARISQKGAFGYMNQLNSSLR